MSKKSILGIAATTHLDKHGERISKELLEEFVAQFYESGATVWSYWAHQTTLPPIQIITDQKVEKREDGEYQLIVEGKLFGEEDFEYMPDGDLARGNISNKQVSETLISVDSSPSGYIEISYDPRNFDPEEINSIITSLNELVPTRQKLYIRKAEFSQVVIFVLVTFTAGFISQFGKRAANKVLEVAPSFYKQLNKKFVKLFEKTNPQSQPDVIFSVPIPDSNVIVEGAVENANEHTLEEIWGKLPELYTLATTILQKNKKGYFSQLKFLFNPSTSKWEVNYLLTQKSGRVIVGPRYSNTSHPLRKRWEDERDNYDPANKRNLGMSIAFTPSEQDE